MTRIHPGWIAPRLLAWYDARHRDLPWRSTTDPYRIWVSEVMLQQTRAEAVIPYYERFLERFPNAAALAVASEQEVLAWWSGLGYYSRARHLHKAARLVADGFPKTYETIRELPGVGDYTAAAISSIAFGLPHAVVDGNVLRVIARVTNDAADIGAAATRGRFRDIAQGWLDRRRAGEFNQALMELGATVCLPRAPRCGICPLAKGCAARQEGRVAQLPVKPRKTVAVKIDAGLVVVERRGRILLWQRDAGDRRLAGFWELPAPEQVPALEGARDIGTFRHTITHHRYRIAVQAGKVRRAPRPLRWVAIAKVGSIPLSTTARKALRLAGILAARLPGRAMG
ncbi:MAG TPA: A/G-specific adenine glycosylase [Bryobacteraceae bacterium]|nr:A/G-specific adenine glycosylase [Bryobacteraceae bacterium]